MRGFVRAVAALIGALTVAVGVWALASPDSFAEFVEFPAHRHFTHDIGAFQIGLGAALLLALIWADALLVALAGYVIAGAVHTVVHAADAHLGGTTAQTWFIGLLTVVAAVALVARWRVTR